MKLKYILGAFLATVLTVSCQPEQLGSFSELSLDKTFVGIPAAGGHAIVTITSNGPWEFSKIYTVGDEKVAAPAWLTINHLSGGAGTTQVKLEAEATDAGRETELQIDVNGKHQYLRVRQGSMTASKATIKEANEAKDGQNFRLTGTITGWYSNAEQYGNFYITDETGTILIYGLADKDGKFKNYPLKSWGLDLGDIVTVEGARGSYKGDPQMVNMVLIEMSKSLIKITGSKVNPTVSETDARVSKKGGEISVSLAFKGKVVYPEVDKEAQEWVSYKSTEYKPGVPTLFVPNPSDTAVVTFTVAPNEGADRKAKLFFTSSTSEQDKKTKEWKTVSTVLDFEFEQAAGFAAFPLPFSSAFTDGIGSWEATDVVPVEGVNGIWVNDATYGMKATAKKKAVGQAELVSPLIDLTTATSPVLFFEHVQRYAGNPYAELKTFVSKDNGESWKEILITHSPGTNWTYIAAAASLAPFAGNQIKIKFQYNSTADAYSTWEIKNLTVQDLSWTATSIAELQSIIPASGSVNFSASLNNAVVTYVNGNNAFIEDATGGVLLYKSGHGLVAGKKISGPVSGTITYYNGMPELTSLDVTSATVEDGEVPTATEVTVDLVNAAFLRYQNCQVRLVNVTLDPALVSNGNRQTTVKQGESTIAGYAKVKTISIDTNVTGALTCWPCYNYATKQVGIWDSAHFTPAN